MEHEENSTDKRIISESTPIRIGLVAGFLVVFASTVWWASSITSKLDTIIIAQAATSSALVKVEAVAAEQAKEINDLKTRIAIIDKTLQGIKK